MRRILIVEDNNELRSMVAMVLRNSGYAVHGVNNGVAAADAFFAQRFDLVLTDIVMPDKEGLELIRELLAADPDVKILATSGSLGSGTYLAMASKLGARGTIPKPFTPDALLEAVRSLIGPGTPLPSA